MNTREVYEILKPLIDDMTFSGEERHIGMLTKVFGVGLNFPVSMLGDFLKVETDPKLKARIALILGKFETSEILPHLEKLLRDPDERVRANAVESIGVVKDPKVVDMLTPMLKDSNNRVVANAAMALWRMGGLRMLNLLVELLESAPDTLTRASAAFALGEIGCLQAAPHLLKALMSNTDEIVVINILKALGKTGDQSQAEKLWEYAFVRNLKFRQAAIEGLMNLGSTDRLETFFDMLDTEEDSGTAAVIGKCIGKLIKIEMVRCVAMAVSLTKNHRPHVRLAAVKILDSLSEPALKDYLRYSLGDEDAKVAEAASAALSRTQS